MCRHYKAQIILILGVQLLISCKRPPSIAATTLPREQLIQISPLVQMPAGKTVHGAVSSRDAICYVYESDDGHDVALVQPPSGVPRAIGLSSANILSALEETRGGTGTIQSLLIRKDDVLWFYFLGGKGKRIDACIGRFDLANERLEIFADATAIRSASRMGDAIGLARGTLLPGTDAPRLLLRHSDRWVILACHPGQAAPLTMALEQAQLDGQPLPLNQDHFDIVGGDDQSMLVLDRTGGSLLRVDANGSAKPLLSLVGLPKELSVPRLRESSIVFFAPDSEKFEGESFDMLHNSAPNTPYPALLTLRDGKISALGGENLRVTGGLSGYSLRLHELIPTPDGNYIAYDSASGTIVKLSWVEK